MHDDSHAWGRGGKYWRQAEDRGPAAQERLRRGGSKQGEF